MIIPGVIPILENLPVSTYFDLDDPFALELIGDRRREGELYG